MGKYKYANLLIHQLIAHSHVMQIRRSNNKCVFLLQPKHRCEYVLFEVLKPSIFLRGKVCDAGHQLKDLLGATHYIRKLAFAPVFLEANRTGQALGVFAEKGLQFGVIKV